jgi:hypothetical protein
MEEEEQESASEKLLVLDHKIRITQHDLGVARYRRRLANVSLLLGPMLAVVLYSVWWIPHISQTILGVITVPTGMVAVYFSIASYVLKRNPG